MAANCALVAALKRLGGGAICEQYKQHATSPALYHPTREPGPRRRLGGGAEAPWWRRLGLASAQVRRTGRRKILFCAWPYRGCCV